MIRKLLLSFLFFTSQNFNKNETKKNYTQFAVLVLFVVLNFNNVHAQCNSGATAGEASSNSSQMCVGTSQEFWSTGWSIGGSWSSSNPSILEVPASPGGNTIVKALAAGTADVIYTVVQANCDQIKTARKTITVLGSSLGTVGQISGTASQCKGNTGEVYSIPPVSGGAVYNWTVPGNWSITSGQGTNSITVTVGAANGEIKVTASNTCASGSNSTTRKLDVTSSNNKTDKPTISGNNTFCSGGSVTLTSSPESSYLWSNGQTTRSIVVTTAGNYSVKTTKNGSCQSDSSDLFTVSQNTAPSISAQPQTPTSTCSGSGIQTISVTATGTGLNYQWLKGGSPISDNSVISGATGATLRLTNPNATDAGNYSVLITGTCSPPVTSSAVMVIVNSTKTVSVASSNPIVCINNLITPITHTTTGATGINLTNANLPNGVSASWESDKITISGSPDTAGTFNYSITLTGGCGNVNATGTITVNSASSAPTGISGTTTVQSGNSTTLSVTGGSLGTGAIVEWFTGSCGGTSAGTGNSITVSPTSDTTYYVRYKGTCNTTACASVVVTVSPPPCIPVGDQIASGNDSWIGHVYKWTGSIPNPDINSLPENTNVVYLGTVTEAAQFDRNMSTNAVSGATTNIICEIPPTDRFFVRYKMHTTTLAGNYVFTIGGDDGARLYIDGNPVVSNWADHGYTLDTAHYNLLAGPHEFVLEYYENGGEARVSISYGLPQGDPTLYGQNTWNVYGYNQPDISLPAANYMGTYVDPNLSFDTQLFWPKGQSPSYTTIWQGAPMNIDNFAFSYKREGFPCGNYQLQLDNFDDEVEIYIDEVQVFHYNGYQTNPMPVGTHLLNKNSKVEVRVREAGGDANAALKFTLIDNPYDGTGTAPTANTPITITSDLTLSTDLEVCSCTIKPGVTLTVPLDRTLTVKETITVGDKGKLLIESGGSLMQTTTSKTAFTGAMDAFELQRETTPVRRYDYTRWSSPVTKTPGFTLHDLSPDTLGDKYWSYAPGSGWKLSYGGGQVMYPGMGYNVRAPQTFSITEKKAFRASFFGIPNNGDYEVTPVEAQYNLIGNPYPSALNAKKFIDDNFAAGTTIGAIYLWTHNSSPVDTDGDGIYTYTTDDYAIYSLSGGIATQRSKSGTGTGNTNEPNGKIAAGQGFFVLGYTGKIKFTNDMRIGANNNQFFKTTGESETERNRIWLNFTNAKGAFKQLLVGYIEGATDSWDDNYDAGTMSSNAYIDFYSINENDKLAIQGRAVPFANTDEVPLGYVTTIAGDFTISIDHVDGLFNEQAIYLEDKITGKEIDLRAGNYTFTTTIGTFTNRFVLRYTSKTLGTGDFENIENGLLVSVKDKVVKVQSAKENIKQISVYDITGKLLYDKIKVSQTEYEIANLRATNQLLVVKITLENGHTDSKKIIIN